MTDSADDTGSRYSADDDPDAWRDTLDLITPSGTWQWLGEPLVFLALGAGGIVWVLASLHGRELSPTGWLALVGVCVVALWPFPLAWFGWRACQRYDLEVSRSYLRLKVGGGAYVLVLLSVAATLAGWWQVVIPCLLAVWAIRTYRKPAASDPPQSAFRASLSRLSDTALLVESVALAVASLGCGLFGLLFLRPAAPLFDRYVGGGIPLFITSVILAVVLLADRRRIRHRFSI